VPWQSGASIGTEEELMHTKEAVEWAQFDARMWEAEATHCLATEEG